MYYVIDTHVHVHVHVHVYMYYVTDTHVHVHVHVDGESTVKVFVCVCVWLLNCCQGFNCGIIVEPVESQMRVYVLNKHILAMSHDPLEH